MLRQRARKPTFWRTRTKAVLNLLNCVPVGSVIESQERRNSPRAIPKGKDLGGGRRVKVEAPSIELLDLSEEFWAIEAGPLAQLVRVC